MFANKAYVEHPISKEDKKTLNKKGYQVLDIKFKPEKLGEDDEVFEKSKPKPKTKK